MSLFDETYYQSNLAAVLKAMGTELEGIVILPSLLGEQVIQDSAGSVTGYVFENEMGGITITDEHTNVIGSTFSQPLGQEGILGESSQYIGSVKDNDFGGVNVTDSTGNTDFLTMENVFEGQNFYTSDMQLLGITQENADQISASGFGVDSFSGAESAGSAIPDIPSFSVYSGGFEDYAVDLSLFDSEIDGADSIFDLFDLF